MARFEWKQLSHMVVFYMYLSGKTSLLWWQLWDLCSLCARPQIKMKWLFVERLGIMLCLCSTLPKGHLFEFVCNGENLLLNPSEGSFIYPFLSSCLCR